MPKNLNTMYYPNIRLQMANKKMTIDALSRKLGMHRNTLVKKLSGERKFYIEEGTAIASILDRPYDWLFKRED